MPAGNLQCIVVHSNTERILAPLFDSTQRKNWHCFYYTTRIAKIGRSLATSPACYCDQRVRNRVEAAAANCSPQTEQKMMSKKMEKLSKPKYLRRFVSKRRETRGLQCSNQVAAGDRVSCLQQDLVGFIAGDQWEILGQLLFYSSFLHEYTVCTTWRYLGYCTVVHTLPHVKTFWA